MSKKTYLFKQSINQILQLILELPKSKNVLPNDIELSEQLNISRTTVRAYVDHLIEQGIIERKRANKVVLRQPTAEDFYDIKNKSSSKELQIRKYFLNLIDTGQLLPGEKFSELSLANNSGCTTITVREFLIKFSSTGLIEKIPRGRWQIVKFDNEFARELVEFREMLEMRALAELLKCPKSHPVWQELQQLLIKHQEVNEDMENRYLEFIALDKELHFIILQSAKNRLTQQFFDLVSFVSHYHYQWDKTGELERFSIAMNEHIDLLNNLITHNNAGAIMSLQRHLNSAEKTLLRCVRALEK